MLPSEFFSHVLERVSRAKNWDGHRDIKNVVDVRYVVGARNPILASMKAVEPAAGVSGTFPQIFEIRCSQTTLHDT